MDGGAGSEHAIEIEHAGFHLGRQAEQAAGRDRRIEPVQQRAVGVVIIRQAMQLVHRLGAFLGQPPCSLLHVGRIEVVRRAA